MSGKLMGQIFGLKLTPAKREVLLAMAENADDDGDNCFPGVPYLAWMTDYSERQIQRIQRALEADGLIVKLPSPGNKPNAWHIDLGKGDKKSPFVPKAKPVQGDKKSPTTQVQDDMMSPRQDVRVTSHGKDESGQGDIASAKTPTILLKDDPLKDKSKRIARAHEGKPYDDVPKQDRLDIIRAWADNLEAPPVGVYKSEANHAAAADLFRDGYRAPQVARFVKAKKADGWWKGKTLTLAKVGELMPEWLLRESQPARASPAGSKVHTAPDELRIQYEQAEAAYFGHSNTNASK